MATRYYHRYLWLINTIYSAKQIPFSEIARRWASSPCNDDGFPYGRRKFTRDCVEILHQFGIDIVCNKRNGNCYSIANCTELQENTIKRWLLNSFAVNAILHEYHPLRSRIIFEDIPSGHVYLTDILRAMKENIVLEITYQGFTRPEPHTFLVAPYCLKVFKQRWYMLGHSSIHREVRTYALDRIQELCFTHRTFNLPRSFSANRYFTHYYGVIADAKLKPQDIRLKAYGLTAAYLRSLPLHHTQQEVLTESGYSIFTYRVSPTYDFLQELRSQGATIEILEPQSLRQAFRNELKLALSRY